MRAIREKLKIIVAHEIVRRYVITNSFDGVLTVLGIVLAEFLSGIDSPEMVVLPSVGAAIALSVSGVWSAYSAERAEIKRKIRDIEAHLMKNLSGTEFSRKREKMAIVIGAVNGLSPLIASLVAVSPFFLVNTGMIGMNQAFYYSMAVSAAILFILGAFAGEIAKEKRILQGFMMLLAGVVTAAIFMLLFYTGLLR